MHTTRVTIPSLLAPLLLLIWAPVRADFWTDIGLRVYDGTSNVVVACEPEGTLTSPLRIAKGGTTYGVVLVEPTDADASGIVIQTASGPKAMARIPSVPDGMVYIPGGSFQMGNCMDWAEGLSDELPVHSVYVSGFFMDKYEVSKALWDEVATWAAANGYDIDAAGASGKAANHPAYGVTWYECVKWCNARSEKEGLDPVYYRSGLQLIVYKVGQRDLTNDAVDWEANGYRLPTEAEWEKAARGGHAGRRFPWGDIISHYEANYRVYWPDYPDGVPVYPYDAGPEAGYHPDHDNDPEPYTSPVGWFPAAGGLHDMAGNVREWCWDWYHEAWYDHPENTQNNTAGPAAGSNRVLRGGYWDNYAYGCRVAYRYSGSPTITNYYYGFRPVRRPSP